MDLDALDDAAGPRSIRWFSILLYFFVLLFAIGAALDIVYDFSLLKDILQPILDRPLVLLEFASFLALCYLLWRAFWWAEANL